MPDFLDLPDGRVAYEVNGSGPPLLLVTGLGGSRRYWANVVPALAREFTVITHDHMGVGDSQGKRTFRPDDGLPRQRLAQMTPTYPRASTISKFKTRRGGRCGVTSAVTSSSGRSAAAPMRVRSPSG